MGLLNHIKRKWSERLVRQANRYLYDFHFKAVTTPDHAVVRCQSAIRMAPDYPEAYLTLGNAYVEKGCLDDALRQFERAVAIDPDFYRGHVRLADTLH